MSGGTNAYLNSKPKVRYPVGKIAGVDSHSYNGSRVIHILTEHLEDLDGRTVKEWRLRCRPEKRGVYSYIGFRAAVTCSSCKSKGAPENEA